jgi:DNA mismatch endonuclease (patch repair protein)
MAAIRSSHTKPELQIRKALHGAGFRYRLHAKELPGRPDLVLARYRSAIFINGCFWHQHDCHLFKWPATREEFWREKIGRNVENDARALLALQEAGWRVGTVWECAIKGRTRLDPVAAMQRLASWIESDEKTITIRGG